LLADFLLEETIGDDVIQPELTCLDPACGSGIFLVGAYRRLIQAWKRKNGNPNPRDLNGILTRCIFGVDKNSEAVRIAEFSLYLEILNHLTNKQIQDESFRLPSLQKKNLIDADFFSEEIEKKFAHLKFDRIIGNMPWGRNTLTKDAQRWLSKNEFVVGGKQAAPAFMLRSPYFCKHDGEMAFIAPAKSTILVTSETHQQFRNTFFEKYFIRATSHLTVLVQG